MKTGASVNGMTALSLAAAKGHYNMVKLLIESSDAKPELKCKLYFFTNFVFLMS